jgi:hypothetical protein
LELFPVTGFQPHLKVVLPEERAEFYDWKKFLVKYKTPLFYGEYRVYAILASAITKSGLAIKGNETGNWPLGRQIVELQALKLKSLEHGILRSSSFSVVDIQTASKIWKLANSIDGLLQRLETSMKRREFPVEGADLDLDGIFEAAALGDKLFRPRYTPGAREEFRREAIEYIQTTIKEHIDDQVAARIHNIATKMRKIYSVSIPLHPDHVDSSY